MSGKHRKRPGPITQPLFRATDVVTPRAQTGGALGVWLDSIKPGYSRFSEAFVAHGWEDQADLLYTRVPAHELVSLLKDAGAKHVQIHRIVAALVDLGYPTNYLQAGPVDWLNEVKEGFGMRYGAAFAADGFEDEDDLKFSCPNQQQLDAILQIAGAATPQVERITAALVQLTGGPLRQESFVSYFEAKERGRASVGVAGASANASVVGAVTSNADDDAVAASDRPPLQMSTHRTSPVAAQPAVASLTEVEHLELLRQRSAALATNGVQEEEASSLEPGSRAGGSAALAESSLAASRWSSASNITSSSPRTSLTKRSSSSSSAKSLHNSNGNGTGSSSRSRWGSTSSMSGTKPPDTTPPGRKSSITSTTSPASTNSTASRTPKDGGNSFAPRRANSSSSSSHHRPARSSSKTSLSTSQALHQKNNKHVMISYQWDNQSEVKAIRQLLEASGIACWLDVDHMQADIYDSMAEGVQGARCIVCCMSQAYQESANCKLELKFAQQSGKPIVPVKMVEDFVPSGWLGIITAGSLWTSVDLDNLEVAVENIKKQIDRTMDVWSKRPGSTFSDTEDDVTDQSSTEDDEEGFSVEDMRGELERLMADLRVAKYSKGTIEGTMEKAAKVNELCVLPAIVPNNPAGLRVTAEMKTLLEALLVTPSVGHKVGFCGMGGLGKTVVSTWLVRQADVRSRFEKIVWITLGQTPNMPKCQQMLFMQLMGFEMSRDMSEDEVKQCLKTALQGLNVLMVLDDAWEIAHCEMLALIDDSTDSKVLTSSRVRGVLEGGSIVDLNLPSDYDAQKMLLNEAGLDADPSDAPKEAAEVTKFCNNLPLAVGMAGRLLKTMSLSIDDDWSGVVAVLKAEFGEGGQARSMENSIIKSSLKSVKGSQRAEVVQLFHAFALVPEDTVCPLEIIGVMYAATGAVHQQEGGSRRLQQIPPRLMVRKWIKILLDRSLILGTVDKPQLHDIVLEYVEGQFDETQARQAHREVIKTFRQITPPRGWCRMESRHDTTAYYVVHEIAHHIEAAWEKDKLRDTEAIAWCSDLWKGRVDSITSAATAYLGVDELQILAEDAAAKKDHWTANLRYAAVVYTVFETTGDLQIANTHLKCQYAQLKLCKPDTPEMQFLFDTLEIGVFVRKFKCLDPEDFAMILERIPHLMATEAAQNDFERNYMLKIFGKVIPFMMTGDYENMAAAVLNTSLEQIEITKTLSDPDEISRSQLLTVGYQTIVFDGTAANPDFVDAFYGERGCKIEPLYQNYDRDTDHADLVEQFSGDLMTGCAGDIKALLFLWGELDRARTLARWKAIEGAATLAIKEQTSELITIWMMGALVPEMFILLGLQSEAHALVSECCNNCAFEDIEEVQYDTIRMMAQFTTSKYPKDGALMNGQGCAWHLKFIWALSAPQTTLDELGADTLFAGLGSPKELVESNIKGAVLSHSHAHLCEISLLCWPALLLERMGLHERAIEFADQALVPDIKAGGSPIAWSHILAHGVKGRACLALGKTAEAVAEFEMGAEVAANRRYKFLEALTLRDLKSALPQATSKHSTANKRFMSCMAELAHGSSKSKENVESVISTLFLTWE